MAQVPQFEEPILGFPTTWRAGLALHPDALRRGSEALGELQPEPVGQQRASLGHSPRVILDELGRIQSTGIVLPLVKPPHHELRIRCVVRPDQAQALLLERLGLELPERLRIPPTLVRTVARM